ncbi:hypothetical protein APHAL10511_008725 [Amanita phalloides]|nr:hypothetical protein APHAL10511_008725 [Amanita phalloides]
MFGGGTQNPYDDIVNKTTDENLTSENWELILNLCDKVLDEGQEGARNVISSLLKRLAHRNPNVQLYALALAESLSKNCGAELHREIASRAFTQGLEKLVTDRNTHEKVRKRALTLVGMWTAEFENDASLGVMEDCYNNLKGKGYKFETPQEPLPPSVDDEIRRKEEEELERVIALSMQDKGGRGQWSQYPSAGSSSTERAKPPVQPSAATSTTSTTTTTHTSTTAPSRSASLAYRQPSYHSGYAPARAESPATVPVRQSPPQQSRPQPYPKPQPQPQPQAHQQQEHRQSLPLYHHSAPSVPSYQQPASTVVPASPTSPTPTRTASTATPSITAPTSPISTPNSTIVTRVRALHTFEPTEPGELAFDKGDIIRVVDRGYKDWWRGQLKGRTGIFPVNYVEPMPEPTSVELAKEADQEASVFAQAMNVEKLLNMLRSFDPAKDNLADNEEIQELYRSCMALRPKIVKLIDKYSQKRADLVSMNETFIRARAIFDRMMEESLAKHTGYYDQTYHAASYDPRGRVASPSVGAGPQPFGWNPSLYDQSGYTIYPNQGTPYPAQHAQHPQYEAAGSYTSATPGPTMTHLPASAPAPAPGAPSYPDHSSYTQGQVYPGPGAYQPGAQLGDGVPYGRAPYPAQAAAQPHAQSQTQPQVQGQAQAFLHDYQAGGYPQQVQAPAGQMPQLQIQPQVQMQAQAYHQDYQASGYPQQMQASGQTQVNQSDYQSQQQQQPTHSQLSQSPPIQAQVPQQQAGLQARPLSQPQAQERLSLDTSVTSQARPQAQQGQGQGPMEVQVQVQQSQALSQQPQLQRHQSTASTQNGPVQVQFQQPQSQQLQRRQSTASTQNGQVQAQTGPPYVFDPHTTYTDPNVQAWAQYYAQGGKDLAGAVYFFSVPGVTDGEPLPAVSPSQPGQGQQGQGQQQQQQLNQGPAQYQYQPQSQANAESAMSVGVESQYQTNAGSSTSLGAGSQADNSSVASSPRQSFLPHTTVAPTATGAEAGQGMPSWVLPKKTSLVGLNVTGEPGSPVVQQAASAPPVASAPGGGAYGTYGGMGAQTYYTLPNQFAGMSVTDQH